MNPPARGFTLIEALVSLTVLSIGLLGAAATMLRTLVSHTEALRRVSAVNLVCDMAERIRANAGARAAYDTRVATAAVNCDGGAACDLPARAAADRAHFEDAALTAFPFATTSADILFEPAIGPTAPDRYVITLRYPARSQPDALEGVELTVLVGVPVAGAG
jgi:type IV pilus assembly protein PilV